MKQSSNQVVSLSVSDLEKATELARNIEAQQNQLTALLSGQPITFTGLTATSKSTRKGGKRVFSEETKKKIALGQQKRWARVHAEEAAAEAAKNGGAKAPASTPTPVPVKVATPAPSGPVLSGARA